MSWLLGSVRSVFVGFLERVPVDGAGSGQVAFIKS